MQRQFRPAKADFGGPGISASDLRLQLMLRKLPPCRQLAQARASKPLIDASCFADGFERGGRTSLESSSEGPLAKGSAASPQGTR